MNQNPDKTDYGDARLLADLQRVGYVPKVWLAPEEVRELRRLVHYRQQLVSDRRNLKLRISALLRDQRIRNAPARPRTIAWTAWIRTTPALSPQSRWIVDRHLDRMEVVVREINEVQKRLAEVTKDDPIVDGLCSYRAIGPVTACDDSRGDRSLRSVSQRQTTGAVLRPEPAECFQWNQASRRGIDQSRESSASGDVDGSIASFDSVRSVLDRLRQ